MTNAQWFLLIGGLLLARGATATLLARLPVTPAIIYLAVGMVAGPTVLDAFHFNPLKQAALLEVLTEVAVLISLFAAGVKMPVPVSLSRWRTPVLLATVSMTVTVGLVAAFAWYLLDLPLGAGILLGAILAPTDPVLATDVQIRHPGDRDQLRYTLTCEAGMNDGSAFPFVMLGLGLLGLHDLGEFGLRRRRQRTAADRQRRIAGVQGTSGTALGNNADPADRRHPVPRFLELAGGGARAVPVRRGAPAERPRRPAGHPQLVADTRHGRLVRRARHRVAVLPDVCDPARLPETLALELIQFTLIVVSLSILAHGTSVKPLMGLFVRHRRSLPPP